MSLFCRLAEKRAQKRQEARQQLMKLSEKELLVEILLTLKEIEHNQAVYSD